MMISQRSKIKFLEKKVQDARASIRLLHTIIHLKLGRYPYEIGYYVDRITNANFELRKLKKRRLLYGE